MHFDNQYGMEQRQHFTVYVNCQSLIINPGRGLRTMQPHYLRAKHDVATSSTNKFKKPAVLPVHCVLYTRDARVATSSRR